MKLLVTLVVLGLLVQGSVEQCFGPYYGQGCGQGCGQGFGQSGGCGNNAEIMFTFEPTVNH
ncbi:hypothetical protein Bhyg_07661 [Pseudolycoriella hygida]|uniref:Uncharacterized protein n=1 Tax=Pseudolycoriella hygida TaxID=35572 RepID=A0A9Q0N3Y5_9DIPT|nr:hypothetical protein Bhyg_07661 [Pseudolycoriella hygida]